MKEKKQIVIIESSASDTLTKVAHALRKKGYETTLVSLVAGIDPRFLKEAYTKVISFESKFFKLNFSNLPKILFYSAINAKNILNAIQEIGRLKPYVVIGRATPNWLCALALKYFRNSPFIYFPYDIRSFSYKSKEHALASGIRAFELDSERYCFKNADGIIHKGNEDELKHLNENVLGKIEIKCPSIYFFPLCLKKFFIDINEKEKLSYKEKGIHLVYVGHVPAEEGWIEGMNIITKQKIYLHLYSKTNNLTEAEEKARLNKIFKGISNNFLRIHETVSQKELSSEIAKYDYGMYSYNAKEEKHAVYATGNKIASYLEAGLPIISPESYISAAKLLRNKGIGIIYKLSELKRLREILRKNKPKKYGKNILKTRESLAMESQISCLEKFFEQVREHNLNHRFEGQIK